MNRRRFLKLFGVAAAAGAVPTLAGEDAALAYAEKNPSELERAFQRLIDGVDDLRRPFVDFGASARSAALATADFDQAMTSVAEQPDELTLRVSVDDEGIATIKRFHEDTSMAR